MKKFIVFMLLCLSASVVSAQSYTRSGNTYISSTVERAKSTTIETTFKVKESDGKEYTVFCSKSTGACFIKKVSRNGNEYKKYLGEEISKEVCKEINVEYKSRKKND